jgi:predicted CxxxxCH...CXXCH cytochrome family protein
MFVVAGLLFSACTSELNDAEDLPVHPVLFGAHGTGYTHLSSTNFHGLDISQNLGWDITGCRTCHGTNYGGGNTGQSCNASGCHEAADGGPEACYVCHGDSQTKTAYPQWYASHATHLNGGMYTTTSIACSDCHNLPENYSDPLHIDAETPGRAEVHFMNVLAAKQTNGTTGSPAYDAATTTCSNVYCHGNFTNGNNISVNWKGSNQAFCGSCHGQSEGNPRPGGTHAQTGNCNFCHTGIIDENLKIIDPTRHVNGILNVFGSERREW